VDWVGEVFDRQVKSFIRSAQSALVRRRSIRSSDGTIRSRSNLAKESLCEGVCRLIDRQYRCSGAA
jgi:hypothetical protein